MPTGQNLTRLVADDAASFDAILVATRLPKATPAEQAARLAALEQATLHAAEVPLQTAEKVVAVIELAAQAAALGNLNAISDAASSAALARAALTSAGLNVRINCQSLQDPVTGSPFARPPGRIGNAGSPIDSSYQYCAARARRINVRPEEEDCGIKE